MKKYKAEFKRQKAKGKKWGEADTIAMKHAALPYVTKPKAKKDVSPKGKLRQSVLKAQEGVKSKPKLKPKSGLKNYNSKSSLLKRAAKKLKSIFSKKKKKKLKTKRTTRIEQQLKKAGVSKKQISKLQGKKK